MGKAHITGHTNGFMAAKLTAAQCMQHSKLELYLITPISTVICQGSQDYPPIVQIIQAQTQQLASRRAATATWDADWTWDNLDI